MPKINVAVDGTAGSGKSAIFKIVAKKLGYVLVDTGLIYRAFTYHCVQKNVNFNDPQSIINALKDFDFNMTVDGKVTVNGVDVTNKLTSKEVVDNINYVTVIKEVRERITEIEKELGSKPGTIELGRDITSVVLPNAKLKIYLDSPLDVRAKRRLAQDKKRGIKENYDEVYESIAKRDDNDMHRTIGALKRTPDAWYIDSSKYPNVNACANVIVNKIREMEKD